MSDQTHDQDDDLVVVFQARDAMSASMVVCLLEGEGIQAAVQTEATAWGGQAAVIDMMNRRQTKDWGVVVVARKDAEFARNLIEAYHTADTDEKLTPLEQQKAEWRANYSWRFVRLLYALPGVWAVVGAGAAWAGSETGRLYLYLMAGATLICGGLAQINARKLVPDQLARATWQASVALIVAGILFGVFYAAVLKDVGIPRSAELVCFSLMAVASAYGAFKHYPSVAQEQESQHD